MAATGAPIEPAMEDLEGGEAIESCHALIRIRAVDCGLPSRFSSSSHFLDSTVLLSEANKPAWRADSIWCTGKIAAAVTIDEGFG